MPIPDTRFASEETLTSTTFTVRIQSATRGLMAEIVDAAWSDEHPIRNVTIGPSVIPHVFPGIYGEVRLTDFRDEDFTLLPGELEPRSAWVPFQLFYPHDVGPAVGAPMAIYGHGMTVAKETALLFASENTSDGLATIAIDRPHHGARGAREGYFNEMIAPRFLGTVSSLVAQSAADFVSLQKALSTSIAELDLLDADAHGLAAAQPDGFAHIDPDRLICQGTSLGTMLGPWHFAVIPEPLPAATLQVGGGGSMHMLTNSQAWEGSITTLRNWMPRGATPAEASVLLAFMQTLLDEADSANWFAEIQRRGTDLLVIEALDDGLVPRSATQRLMGLGNVPYADPLLPGPDHPPSTSRQAVFDSARSGRGPAALVVQVDPGSAGQPFEILAGLLSHLSFVLDAVKALEAGWRQIVLRNLSS